MKMTGNHFSNADAITWILRVFCLVFIEVHVLFMVRYHDKCNYA